MMVFILVNISVAVLTLLLTHQKEPVLHQEYAVSMKVWLTMVVQIHFFLSLLTILFQKIAQLLVAEDGKCNLIMIDHTIMVQRK